MKVIHQILILIGVTCLVYFPSLFNQFVWDDEQFVYKNQYVINFDLPKIFTTNTIAGAGQLSDYYRPLTTLSFALDHALWQLTPFGFHLTSISLHLAAGIILFLLLRELGLRRAALIIALIFLLHPLQTEAVTNISSRGDPLYAWFGLLSLWLLTISYRRRLPLQLTKASLLFLSSLFYFGAILAKEIGLMILGLQLLIVFIVAVRESTHIKAFSKKIFNSANGLYFLSTGGIALTYVLLRATKLNFQNTFNLYQIQTEYTTQLSIRLLTFSKVLWIYFKLIIFPYPLYMDRTTGLVTSLMSPWPWLTGVLLLTITALAIWEIKQRRAAWITCGSLWFLISLSPVSGIIPINGLLYEHWLYLPLVGWLITIYGIIYLIKVPAPFLQKIKSLQLPKYFFMVLFSIYALLTIRQNWLERSPIPYYEYLLKHTQSARIHNNLAMAYSEKQNYEPAIDHYQQALQIADIYPQTHHNLGLLYAAQGDLVKAEREFTRAIELSPSFHFSYLPLINIYIQQKKIDRALPLLETMITSYPDNQQLHQLKAALLKQQAM